MRREILILAGAIWMLLSFSVQSWAVCPEDTVDRGECDTLYVEICPGDEVFNPARPLVRFPIYVTHDLPDPVDSILAFVIPACFTSSNPAANAHLPDTCNKTILHPFPMLWQSAFRHLYCGTEHYTNWMMALSEEENLKEWDTRIINLVGEGEQTQVFWMSLFPTGSEDQHFWEGSRVLVATMTFKLEDTTTICIDSCFWPPNSRLSFTRMDAASYIPRHLLPIRERILIPGPPPIFLLCPGDEVHYGNGTGFQSEEFRVWESDVDGQIVSVSAEFSGSGVENVHVLWNIPPPAREVSGHVSYDVTDCGADGGTITITAVNDRGAVEFCDFDVMLPNNPPVLNLPDSWLALAGYTLVLPVSADDPENDSPVTVNLEAFWYEPDSLQAPTNAPSYYGGNPGFFNWVPEEADTGIWVCSFSASDSFGCETTDQVAIQVGMPFCGDCTGEGRLDASDVVYLIGYLFKDGPAPDPLCKGDANCNAGVEAGDLVYLINYLFRYGPAPCLDCCP
jgi:hypothetical protein